MSKTDTAVKKKPDLRTIVTIIIIIAVALGTVFTVKKFISEKEKNETVKQEQGSSADSDDPNDNSESKFAKPIATYGDTDNTRRYGYDVLYANHGLRILLKESKIYISEPELTFEFINESDTDFTAKIDYCVINGQNYHPFLNTVIPAGKTVFDTTVFNFTKMKEIKISKLRLCFKISNSDFSIYEDSDAIRIDYDNSPNESWNAPSDAVNVYKTGVYSVDAQPVRYSNDTKGYKLESNVYFRNDTVNDMLLYIDSCKMFDKNSREINEDKYYASFMVLAPGNSLAYDHLSVIVDSAIDREDLGELLIIAKMSPRTAVKNKEAETVTFSIPLN